MPPYFPIGGGLCLRRVLYSAIGGLNSTESMKYPNHQLPYHSGGVLAATPKSARVASVRLATPKIALNSLCYYGQFRAIPS